MDRLTTGRAVVAGRLSCPHALLLALLLVVAACGSGPRRDVGRLQELSAYDGELDSLGVAEFGRLPAAEQDHRRELAREWVERAVRTGARELRPMDFLPKALSPGQDSQALPIWTGYRTREPWQLKALVRAVGLDPTNAHAWCELGCLVGVMGDRIRAAAALEQAAAVMPRAGGAAGEERELRRRIHVERAWLCYDLGWPDLGLAWVAAADPAGPPTDEQRLLRALLLGQAGRTQEAVEIAADLPTVEVHPYGGRTTRSGFPARWALAMARLGAGDPAAALREFEPLYPYEAPAPLLYRYWNDVGLLRELNGQEATADEAYARAILYLPHAQYFPLGGVAGPRRVFGQPGCDRVFYAGWQHYHVAGSLYAYAMQAADLAAGGGAGSALAPAALEALEACRRRGIRPREARIGRACLLAALGDLEEADRELAAIEGDPASELRVDGAVLTVRGKIALLRGDHPKARERLDAAVAAAPRDAGAWSALAVARIRGGDQEGARAALDRAVTIDASLVPAWFNRGLLNLEQGRWDEARADLRRAAELAPGNEQVLSLMAAAEIGERLAPDAGRTADLSVSLRPSRPSSSLVASAPVSEERLDHLEAERLRSDSPETRRALARAYLEAGRATDVAALLAAGWPADLDPAGRLMLLQADRLLGQTSRARELILTLHSEEQYRDSEALTLAALVCLEAGLAEEGLAGLEKAIAVVPTSQAAPLEFLKRTVEGTGARRE